STRTTPAITMRTPLMTPASGTSSLRWSPQSRKATVNTLRRTCSSLRPATSILPMSGCLAHSSHGTPNTGRTTIA
ncbi:hypothetical protein ETB97_006710, partial [Aspergillus alliaceus]